MLRTREFRCHFMPWFFGLLLVPGSNKKGDFLRFAAPGIWRMVIPRWIFGVFPSWDGWHDGTYRTDERRICPHVVLPRYSLQNLLLFFFSVRVLGGLRMCTCKNFMAVVVSLTQPYLCMRLVSWCCGESSYQLRPTLPVVSTEQTRFLWKVVYPVEKS